LEQRNHDLQKLDKLKSEFISTVSHELRTPLAIIRESVAQTLEGIHGPVCETQIQTLNLALRSTDRLTRLVTDLLDLSRIEFGRMKFKLEPLDLAACVKETALALTSNAKKKGIELIVDAPASLQTYADRDKVEQILTNLIVNAIKFTDKGSVKLTLTKSGSDALIAVEDTGIGISDDDLHRVFSKFEQFSRERTGGEKGAGLGLAICKGLAEMHGGSIRVRSRLGEGSRFEVRLPLRGAADAAAELLKKMKEQAVSRGTSAALATIKIAGAAETFDLELQGAVRECLRRQDDMMIYEAGRVWVLLPDVESASAKVIFERIRERVDGFLKSRTPDSCAAEYNLELMDPQQMTDGGTRSS
ncbi:MAG: HAMP domain-containing histidine kinase, partial [Candidatus Omnitrophica bacterium]|nr:HAMP domain-containing histidine kinase [Candidatus Omnitrophota bacterium]